MIAEYNLTLNMLSDNATDRDQWYSAIKTAIINNKPGLPAYKSIVGRKGESLIENSQSENI